MEAEERKALAGVFDRLVDSNLELSAETRKLHKSIDRYVRVALGVIVVSAAVSGFEIWHAVKTDSRIERLEEKVFQK